MHSIGIDVGAAQHSVAICRQGNGEAERQVLRIRDRVDLDDLASATMKPITANARPPTVMTAPAAPFTR